MIANRTSLFEGMWQHLVLLLKLKHDGTGLPGKCSPVVFGLLAMQTVLTILLLVADPSIADGQLAGHIAMKTLVLFGILFFMAIPLKCVEVLVGCLLFSVVRDASFLLVDLAGLTSNLNGLMFCVLLWGVAIQLSLFKRHFDRIKPTKKTKK